LEKTTTNLLQIALGGPNLEQQNLLLATLRVVTNAKKYLYIQSPYFLPTQGLVEGLKIAAL
jgi:cardiolipin synthase